MPFLIRASLNKKPQTFNFTGKSLSLRLSIENGSKGARTLGLPLVRRALIPAELCFHVLKYNTDIPKWEAVFLTLNTFKVSRSCALPTRNPLSGKPPVSAQPSPPAQHCPGSNGQYSIKAQKYHLFPLGNFVLSHPQADSHSLPEKVFRLLRQSRKGFPYRILCTHSTHHGRSVNHGQTFQHGLYPAGQCIHGHPGSGYVSATSYPILQKRKLLSCPRTSYQMFPISPTIF